MQDKVQFYIQDTGNISIEGASFIDACNQINWLNNNNKYTYTTKKTDLDTKNLIIPVGSIEFTQQFIRENNLPELVAMNIPDEVNDRKYLGRRIWNNMTIEDVINLNKNYPFDLLIKPGKNPKRFETTPIRYINELPKDEPLFVSEILKSKIVSEWRVFSYKHRILSIRPYLIDDWKMPDKNTVIEVVNKIHHTSTAIDFAVLDNGMTVIIEAHPFISCGLYGFEGQNIIRMAVEAWKTQVKS